MRFADLLFRLQGATSGETIVRAAAAASGTITLPAGTTDFSGTGGAGQVVKQTSAGGPFTVAQVAAATDISGTLAAGAMPAYTGDVTSPAGSTVNTLANTAVTAAAYTHTALTVDGKGRITAAANGTLTGDATLSGNAITLNTVPVAKGGTGATMAGAALTSLGAAPVASPSFTGNVTIAGTLTSGNAVSTGDAVIELGAGRTGVGNAYIDLHTTVGSDYELRLIRNSGANGSWGLINTGTGPMSINMAGANTLTLDSSGNATIAGSLGVGGATPPGGGNLSIAAGVYVGASTGSADAAAKIGDSRSADGNAYLDFQAQGTGTHPDLRIIRAPGVNGTAAIQQAGTGVIQISASAGVQLSPGIQTRAGTAGGYTGHNFNIDWTGTAQLWMDTVNVGQFSFVSDYRIKTNVDDLPSMWDRVKALRPVRYERCDYGELFKADPAERWGFIAHELQESLLETAASGKKDEENVFQSPDLLTLAAVTTKALQEAMARIEALEARLKPS